MPTSTEEIDIAKLLINGRQGRAFRDFDRDMKEWLKAQYMHMRTDWCVKAKYESDESNQINNNFT